MAKQKVLLRALFPMQKADILAVMVEANTLRPCDFYYRRLTENSFAFDTSNDVWGVATSQGHLRT